MLGFTYRDQQYKLIYIKIGQVFLIPVSHSNYSQEKNLAKVFENIQFSKNRRVDKNFDFIRGD